MRKFTVTACLAALLVTTACDGGSGGTPTPSPSPSPSPAPSPSPSPSPSPAPAGPANFAGAQIGSTLQVRRACSSSRATYSNGTITGIQSLGPVTLIPPETARRVPIDGVEAFGTGFGRSPVGSSPFTIYESLADFTLAVVNTSALIPPSATFGYTDYTTLCFFAAGLAPPSSTVQPAYDGRADGLYQTLAGARRLFMSRASAAMNTSARTGTLSIQFAGYTEAFPNLATQTPTPIATLTATIAVTGNQVSASSISGLAGFTGTIAGELVGPDGMILVFELHDAAGSVIWGSAALDNVACAGCWDY